MKREDFFLSDGSVNMHAAMNAGRTARGEAVRAGAVGLMSFFRGRRLDARDR